jgi:hypothetical protein
MRGLSFTRQHSSDTPQPGDTDLNLTQTAAATASKPTADWQFTPTDLEYLKVLTERMIAIGSWDVAERITTDEVDTVAGASIQFDAWFFASRGGIDGPSIERHDNGTYYLMDGASFAIIAEGKTLKDVLRSLPALAV